MLERWLNLWQERIWHRRFVERSLRNLIGRARPISRSGRLGWRVRLAIPPAAAKSSKNSNANRIETGERSGGIGEICSVEVAEK
jgi:hypothetical protein